MNICRHQVLRLVAIKDDKVQCAHCGLIITEDELGGGCCPECLEVHKVQRRDFSKHSTACSTNTRYCCDQCGMIVEC